MLDFAITADDRKAVEHERFHHADPNVRRRMETVWLKSHNLSHAQIARLNNISETTVRAHLDLYVREGLAGLRKLDWYQPQGELAEHAAELRTYFATHPPHTAAEAQAVIEAKTGIRRGLTQVRAFLHDLGMEVRKVGAVPSKGDAEAQEAFKTQALLPRLEAAQAGQRDVYFVDAAHFVFRAFLGMVWCFQRLFVPAPAGRKRFNVLAALHATSHALITVTNETYINAESVCALLHHLVDLARGLPITVVLDNARYQRCKLVQNLASALQIELLFLPPYSPHLNLIERMWKHVKKQCLYNRYYASFEDFQRAIRTTVDNTQNDPQLSSLLTLNFQTLPSASPCLVG